MTAPTTEHPLTTDNVSTSDTVLDALEGLSRALEENAEEVRMLTRRIRAVSEARRDGTSWSDVLAADVEEGPGTLQLLSSVLARLSTASGALRRALVAELRSEGATIPTIAKLFGVTHQRVSNLLRRSSD